MRARLQGESGFTLIEVMVASLVLLVGLAGTLGMLDLANRTTNANAARDGAVALQRELIETARSMSYSALTPGHLSADLRALPSLSGSTVTAAGWTIRRGGRDYHVAMGVCIVDSVSDGLGAHDASTFCQTGTGASTAAQCRAALGTSGRIQGTGTATGGRIGDCGIDTNADGEVDGLIGLPAASGTADATPEDFKRIVTLIRWDTGGGSRFVLSSSTLPYPGLSAAPSVTTLSPDAGSLQDANPPTVSSSAQTVVPFTAATNRAAASVGWFLNGSPIGSATDAGGAVSWAFSWNLGAVDLTASAPGAGEAVDGSYTIGARAYNRYAAGGQLKATTVKLNRRPPFRPAGFEAVHVGTRVEAAWSQAVEGDVEGFLTYRVSGATRTVVCALSRATSCTDASPPSTGTFTYQTVAVDRDPAGAQREGQIASVDIPLDNKTPQPPTNLQATRAGTQVTLTWTASAGDPDGTVQGYRIFRDGKDVRSRYAGTTALTYTDATAGDVPHTYCVAAVDDLAGQSACSAEVTA
jgi:prepilin-type N-terminal cleavage/methylation domain-containing protein